MANYPIWNKVYTDCYKTSKDFGSRKGFSQTINIGTSAVNTEVFAEIDVKKIGNKFYLYVDGKLIKEQTYEK